MLHFITTAANTQYFAFSSLVTIGTGIVALTIDPESTAFLIAVGGVISIILAGLANLISVLRTTSKKQDALVAKVDVIEGHVNSAATRDAAIIEAQAVQMAMLRQTIVNQEKQAALLAQAQAVTNVAQSVAAAAAIVPIVAPVAAPVAPVEHLQAIEENTEETAKNTKRTEETVKEIKKQQ